MRRISCILTLALLIALASSVALAGSVPGISANDAMAKLVEGNKQFAAGKAVVPDNASARRLELTKSQHPFAIIVSCSDSRVPPEIVFNQGLGQLFVVRAAGHAVDEIGLGSIEYAVEHLGAQLIVVLGHEKCGAVAAAAGGGAVPGHIHAVVKAIEPAVDKAKSLPGDLVSNAIDANVDLVVNQLTVKSPILKEFSSHGKLKITGAVYDLDDGLVTFR